MFLDHYIMSGSWIIKRWSITNLTTHSYAHSMGSWIWVNFFRNSFNWIFVRNDSWIIHGFVWWSSKIWLWPGLLCFVRPSISGSTEKTGHLRSVAWRCRPSNRGKKIVQLRARFFCMWRQTQYYVCAYNFATFVESDCLEDYVHWRSCSLLGSCSVQLGKACWIWLLARYYSVPLEKHLFRYGYVTNVQMPMDW